MKPIITSVVGYGFSGKVFQCPFIDSSPYFKLHSVVKRTGKEPLDDYPNIQLYRSIDEMLTIDEIELVVIATPVHNHYEHALKALEHQKHVLVEKPFTVTKKEAIHLIKKAKEVNRVITVYQNRRFDSDYLTIKELLKDDITVFEMNATWEKNGLFIKDKWKEKGLDGGNLVYDLGSHFLDQTFELFGYPKSYNYTVDTIRPNSNIIDYFTIQLKYDHMIVNLKSSLHNAKSGVRYKLHTNKGSYYFYNMDLQESQLLNGMSPLDHDYGDNQLFDFFDFEGNTVSKHMIKGNYLDFFHSLYKSIREGKELIVSNESSIKLIEFLEEISKKTK
jgi:scyllo-inositol 2-dehydrogenase (NADP+)